MRQDVFERMKLIAMEKIKPNYSAVARQLQVDRRTVKAAYQRALTGQEFKQLRCRKRRSKLDGYRDIITTKIKAGCSARAIYGFIQTKGFTGKYTIVKIFVGNLNRRECGRLRPGLNIRSV